MVSKKHDADIDKLHFSPPQSYEQLDAITGPDKLYVEPPGGLPVMKIVRYAPGVIVKYGSTWEQTHAEEVVCLRFANELGLPVPKVLYHPGIAERRVPWTLSVAIDEPNFSEDVWCICMEEVRGIPLANALDFMSNDHVVHVAHQLKEIVARIANSHSSSISSVTGNPLRTLLVPSHCQPDCTFSTTSEFMRYLLSLLAECYGSNQHAAKIIAPLLNSDDHADSFCFAHGDLLPKNIMVDPENGYSITAVLDWENAGFYPSDWDYYRMHDPNFMTAKWSQILDIVYDQRPRDDAKIIALSQTLVTICNRL